MLNIIVAMNKILLIGHLGKDPEVKKVGDMTVCNVSLATSEKRKDKDGGVKEVTDWHSLVFWNKAAEVMQAHAQKGTHMYVEGKQQTRGYTGSDGVKKYVTENVVTSFELLAHYKSNHVGGQDFSRSEPPETSYTAGKDEL